MSQALILRARTGRERPSDIFDHKFMAARLLGHHFLAPLGDSRITCVVVNDLPDWSYTDFHSQVVVTGDNMTKCQVLCPQFFTHTRVTTNEQGRLLSGMCKRKGDASNKVGNRRNQDQAVQSVNMGFSPGIRFPPNLLTWWNVK